MCVRVCVAVLDNGDGCQSSPGEQKKADAHFEGKVVRMCLN